MLPGEAVLELDLLGDLGLLLAGPLGFRNLLRTIVFLGWISSIRKASLMSLPSLISI